MPEPVYSVAEVDALLRSQEVQWRQAIADAVSSSVGRHEAEYHSDRPTPPGEFPLVHGWGRLSDAEMRDLEPLEPPADLDFTNAVVELGGRRIVGNGQTWKRVDLRATTGDPFAVEYLRIDNRDAARDDFDCIEIKAGRGYILNVTPGPTPDEGIVIWNHGEAYWQPPQITIARTFTPNARAEASTQVSHHAVLIGARPGHTCEGTKVSMYGNVYALQHASGRHLDRHPMVSDGAWVHSWDNLHYDWNTAAVFAKEGARVLARDWYNPIAEEHAVRPGLVIEHPAELLPEFNIEYEWKPSNLDDAGVREQIRARSGHRPAATL